MPRRSHRPLEDVVANAGKGLGLGIRPRFTAWQVVAESFRLVPHPLQILASPSGNGSGDVDLPGLWL